MENHEQAFHRAGFSPPAHTGSFAAMMAAQQAANGVHSVQAQPLPSTSPTAVINSFSPPRARATSASFPSSAPRVLTPFDTGDIKILLLENVSQGAVAMLREQGYQVDFHTVAWSEDQLIEKIGQYHAIGIRSKTKLTQKVFRAAHKLLVVGCFCIGTNQVDLIAAAKAGVAVFNSPFANSRSVAELVIGEMISLSRQLADRVNEMRVGTWNKVSKGCYEVRGKVLGIVGYGHIGSQLSVLAEAMGMQVFYFDVVPLMPLGSARQIATLEELLGMSDFVSLHVPELPETKNMIGIQQIQAMKKGSYLLNNARGSVVDIPALIEGLKSGHLAGAAVDVFPREPAASGENAFGDELNTWATELRKQKNVMLTPHIGGSTEEAQRMIGIEVGNALCRYINYGGSVGAVNFPEVDLRAITEQESRVIRICYVHQNQPGSLRAVNEILGGHNVDKQHSDSYKDIAYLMADISGVSENDIRDIYDRISKTPANILTRLLS
ncbi:putative 3-phosphoglycerate dehydrogenase [Violaceomyces palustris]|uniref:3-phosphoglycerate dehydrogenase n=1 Tax=Violaceomyces palustris TaxID=1673888 RepID=A0ACD0NQK9_9BASI|nr:putative 3-phosphoglycerate dehydrogenase [Violaceomyces palustris]